MRREVNGGKTRERRERGKWERKENTEHEHDEGGNQQERQNARDIEIRKDTLNFISA